MIEPRNAATSQAQFAATDMLHRRVPLSSHFHVVLGDRAVRIKTDSWLIGKAIRSVKLPTHPPSESGVAEWEISVEVRNGSLAPPIDSEGEQVETHCFGPSCSVRLADGSWFAHTPPSLNGVGFAMVTGDDCHQVQQLAIYLKTIQRFVAENTTQTNRSTECEVNP